MGRLNYTSLTPKQGEIYLVNFPNQPIDSKDRPAIIVSLDIRNKLAEDVIVIPLSTTLRQAPTHVIIPEGEGNLNYDSMAKCEQITTLHKSYLLRGPLGKKVNNKILRQIERAVLRAIGVPI